MANSIFHVKVYNTGYRHTAGFIYEGFVFDDKIFAKNSAEAKKKAFKAIEKEHPKKKDRDSELFWHCLVIDKCERIVRGDL